MAAETGLMGGDLSPEHLQGYLRAHRFMLEYAVASLLLEESDPVAACATMAQHALREFESYSPDGGGAAVDPTDGNWRSTQYGLSWLEEFWAGVEGRVTRNLT